MSIQQQAGQLQQPVAVVGPTKAHRGAYAVYRIGAYEFTVAGGDMGWLHDHDGEVCKRPVYGESEA